MRVAAVLGVAAFLHGPVQIAAQGEPPPDPAPSERGQSPPGGTPLWWEVALGGGSTHLTCDLCQPGRELGPALDLAVGTWARPGLRVGLDGGGWTHDDDGTRESVFRAGVTAQFHPGVGGLHLVGGVGWTGYRAGDFRYDAARLSVGAGWEVPLAAGLVVGNRVVVDAASFGTLANGESAVAGSVGLSLVRATVHVRKH